MLFRQCHDSFIRSVGPYGYVTNQKTKHDRVFDTAGREFLKEITREPRPIEEAVRSIVRKFVDASAEVVRPDFVDFLGYLEKHQFSVSGETVEELDRKDQRFSYREENPKTFTFDFRQNDEGLTVDDSQQYLDAWLREHPTLWSLQLEVTSKCNERCVHCYIPHEEKTVDIDFELAESVIDQASDMGAIGITFGGGEPTIYARLPELLRHARARDFSINVISNCMSLPDPLFEAIVETHPSMVQVSIYSLKEEEHDAITKVRGSLKRTLASVERLIAANVPMQVSCPVMKTNYRSYKEVLSWAYDRKVRAYTDFIMMARMDKSTENLAQRLSASEARTMLEDIVQVDEDYRIMVAEETVKRLFKDQTAEPVCGVGISTLCVGANGACYPCSGWQGFAVGDLANAGLRGIWETSPNLEYLRGITRGRFARCLDCADQNYCAMCMVRNYNETGDIFTIPPHFCQMASLNRAVVEEHRANKR